MIKKLKYLWFVSLFCAATSFAQQVSVFATTDSIEYFVGDYIEFQLQLKYDNSLEVVIPSVKDSIDVLEFIRELPVTKNEVDGKINELRRYVFSSYDSAQVVIPGFLIDYRRIEATDFQKVRTNPVTITVHTLDVDSQADIQDVKSPVKIPFDWIFWGIIIICSFLILTVGYLIYRYYQNKKKGIEPKKVKIILPPYKIAINKLRELEKAKLWQQGNVKEYHFQITHIIRKYFEGRFSFDALEMPSSEVMEKLKELTDAGEIFDESLKFFENADLVKFAKFQPMPSVNDEMMEQAYSIVDKTKRETGENEELIEENANV